MLANGNIPPAREFDWEDNHHWPDDLGEIIYIDHFGNCITGVRAGLLDKTATIEHADKQIKAATSFSDVNEGTMFWYENANVLVEIAVNLGDAARKLNLEIGTEVDFSASI